MAGYQRHAGGAQRGSEEVSGAGFDAAVGGEDGGGGKGAYAGDCDWAGVDACCCGLSFFFGKRLGALRHMGFSVMVMIVLNGHCSCITITPLQSVQR